MRNFPVELGLFHAGAAMDQPRKFPCPWPGCDKAFNRIQHLQQHTYIHENITPLKCPVAHCVYGARQKSQLKKHMHTKHPDLVLEMLNEATPTKQSMDSDQL